MEGKNSYPFIQNDGSALRQRKMNCSQNFNSNDQQVKKLIYELGNVDINVEAKTKTIETLNAITGML
eukprot:CAMPEP_0170543440 /NCGR_PEP_ID=MMETSP0211-20121228/2552_1 /TAXON_ID=311385 /ORGANISM="Pseudokeronopsis sp., Strain OXSARD2" /LENGTH=66 /DNA_ID=CAMNT_0010846813 /DNA_START=2233 /DNA_END=2433 /DNA_ORIENTATION=+